MEKVIQEIPDALVYEKIGGDPIYYKGFRQYLAGIKEIEEIRGNSKLQSFLVAALVHVFRKHLADEYLIFANGLGLQLDEYSWRIADVAMVKSERIDELDSRYLNVAPELVIQIDTKADLDEIKNPFGYWQEKTIQLLEFGVQKVIWIFTDTQRVMIAEDGDDWQIISWHKELAVLDGVKVNIQEIILEAEK